MQDMVVSLLGLPTIRDAKSRIQTKDVSVRRAQPADTSKVTEWAAIHFGGWAAAIRETIKHDPPTLFLATRGQEILGFSAYDATFPNFFGPTGVLPEHRRTGIGQALLVAALHAQREQGYAYSIIGGVGPAEYYAQVVGAKLLDGPAAILASGNSEPGT